MLAPPTRLVCGAAALLSLLRCHPVASAALHWWPGPPPAHDHDHAVGSTTLPQQQRQPQQQQIPLAIGTGTDTDTDDDDNLQTYDPLDLCGLGSARLSLPLLLDAAAAASSEARDVYAAAADDMLVSRGACADEIEAFLGDQARAVLRGAGLEGSDPAEAIAQVTRLHEAARRARLALAPHDHEGRGRSSRRRKAALGASRVTGFVQQVHDLAVVFVHGEFGALHLRPEDLVLAWLERGGEVNQQEEEEGDRSAGEEGQTVEGWLRFARETVGLPFYQTYPDLTAAADGKSHRLRLRLDRLARNYRLAMAQETEGVVAPTGPTAWLVEAYDEWKRRSGGAARPTHPLPAEVADAHNMARLVRRRAAGDDEFVTAFAFLMQGGGSASRYRALARANRQLATAPESVCMRGLGLGFLDRVLSSARAAWMRLSGSECQKVEEGVSPRVFCGHWGSAISALPEFGV
ncbi:uncharacterized protein E0L32_006792 [Thyridium curvatum]|uniref:Uncharacterized protein n=1 Tax=Thyridium curvatum TaxID=1093900 RepID=A0A507ASE0_9PEZI|nr:uncharacterized protein E0L32_006792 [Thyridium curvatum]TPX12912.1 hypothetical protein E0L32_006792 [Thyridium curvatum]